jgi:hypothetical protein
VTPKELLSYVRKHWSHETLLSPPDRTQPPDFQNQHRMHRDDANGDAKWKFDARCPRCRFDRKDKGK